MLDDRFFGALLESVSDDNAFDTVLNVLAKAFQCRSAALVYIDTKTPAATIARSVGVLDAEAQRRYREEFAAHDPAPAAMARLRLGQVATTGRLFDAEAPEHRRFIEGFYHPLGLREAMGGPVATTPGRNGILAVQRGADRGAFNDGDMAAFTKVIPHVSSALRLRRRFFDLEEAAGTMRSALDDATIATMIFDARGALRHANLAARALVERRDGLLLARGGRLGAADAAADDRLRSLFLGCSSAKDRVVRVPRAGAPMPYVVKASAVGGTGPRGGVTLRICDPSIGDSDTAHLIGFALGMTQSSAELTAALVGGDDVAAYAQRTGVSLNTMKFRLKSAFAATGTRRQADLVRIATSVIRDLR